MQIKRLEEILDLHIFDRSSGVDGLGCRIVSQAKLALEHFARIASLAGHHGGDQGDLTGTVRIGIIPTLTRAACRAGAN